jgi:3-oxoacyl-[acyl-carrier-protein] synthase II
LTLEEDFLNRRVVITGLGLVTPLGIGVEETWQALCAGKSGIGEITRFDVTPHNTKIAGEVKDFNAQDFLPKKEARRVDLFIAYAMAAARMALEDARLVIDSTNANRIGAVTGCGLGGLSLLEQTCLTLHQKGPRRVSPFFIPLMIGNMVPGMISIHLGAKGPNLSLATACAAGTHAVGNSFRIIQKTVWLMP